MFKQSAAAFLPILLAFFPGCGSGVGNPANPELGVQPLPVQEYEKALVHLDKNGVDCGAYTEISSPLIVDAGRECIRQALKDCRPAVYLLNEQLENGDFFVSFVSVTTGPGCTLNVHTVSTDETRFVGAAQKSCSTLAPDEEIELACGIGK